MFFVQPQGQLCAAGGFPGTLQPDHQEDARGLFRKLQLGLGTAQQLNQLVANNLDHLLPGSQGFQDFLSKSPLLDALDKLLGDFEMNIRIQQGIAYFARGLLDMTPGDSSLSGKFRRIFCSLLDKLSSISAPL